MTVRKKTTALSNTELRMLRNLHLRGVIGRSGSLTLAQRRKIFQKLINEGYLTKTGQVTKKGINISIYKTNPSPKLPSLTGSEKQIEAATKLRDIVINSELEKTLQAKIDKYKKLIPEKPRYKERLDVVKNKLAAYNYMINIQDSNFWLNNKNLIANPYMSMEYFLSDFIERTKHPLSKYKIPKSNPLPKKAYNTFHGKNPRKIKTQTMYIPENGLVQLGKVYAIEYECSKLNGGGDGTKAIYRHEFESPAVVACDDRCKKQLYIFGPKIRVSKAGIEG